MLAVDEQQQQDQEAMPGKGNRYDAIRMQVNRQNTILHTQQCIACISPRSHTYKERYTRLAAKTPEVKKAARHDIIPHHLSTKMRASRNCAAPQMTMHLKTKHRSLRSCKPGEQVLALMIVWGPFVRHSQAKS